MNLFLGDLKPNSLQLYKMFFTIKKCVTEYKKITLDNLPIPI